MCRQALPVINPIGAEIQINRIVAFGDNGTRIDYRVSTPQSPARARFIICQFKASGLQANRQELDTVRTEDQLIKGAPLYVLRRFWLETPDALLADPGIAAERTPDRATIARPLAIFLQHLLSALPLMSIYGLLAGAYALVYGLVGRINLAFGEFAAMGSIGAVLGITLGNTLNPNGYTLPVMLAGGIAILLTAGHGIVSARLIMRPLAARPGQQALVATAGLAIALQEYLRLSQGDGVRWVSPILNRPWTVAQAADFSVTVTPMTLVVSITGLFTALCVLAMLWRTRFGRAWRAVADDPLAAALCGVSSARIYGHTFALACGVAGLAGLLMTLFYGGIGYAGGTLLGLKALVGAVAGGIGSVPGAMLGGILIGIIEAGWSALLPIENRDVALFAALVALLALKPGGLFGLGALSVRRV